MSDETTEPKLPETLEDWRKEACTWFEAAQELGFQNGALKNDRTTLTAERDRLRKALDEIRRAIGMAVLGKEGARMSDVPFVVDDIAKAALELDENKQTNPE